MITHSKPKPQEPIQFRGRREGEKSKNRTFRDISGHSETFPDIKLPAQAGSSHIHRRTILPR